MARSPAVVVKRSSGYSYRLEGGKLEGKSGKVKRAAAAYGSGRRPLQSSHAQTIAVTEPKAPATRPMARGPTYCDAMPAADMDTIMTLQRMDSMVLNTRPRNWSGVCRRSWALGTHRETFPT